MEGRTSEWRAGPRPWPAPQRSEAAGADSGRCARSWVWVCRGLAGDLGTPSPRVCLLSLDFFSSAKHYIVALLRAALPGASRTLRRRENLGKLVRFMKHRTEIDSNWNTAGGL